MTPSAILEQLTARGIRLRRDGEYLVVVPKAALTDQLRALIKEHKPELLAALATDALPEPATEDMNGATCPAPVPLLNPASEARLKKVVERLTERPDLYRAVVADDSGLDGVIVTVAVRGVGAYELLIPREKWDPWLFLEIVERSGSILH